MVFAHRVDGTGPERVIVLHDWLCDSASYDEAMPYFDTSALTICRVDFPGYGASCEQPVRGVGADVLDAGVLEVADARSWSRFHLVAHSMSTVVAQRLARSAAARLASVVLVTPVTPGTRYPDPIIDALRAAGRQPERRRGAVAQMWGERLSTRWLDLKVERWIASSEPEAVAAYVDLFARPELETTRIAAGAPVVAITGELDAPPFRREAVEPALAAVHESLALEPVPTGHYPMQEAPPLFATLVERFVRQHAAR